MANSKIENLTELTSVVDADVLAIVDDPSGTPVTKKITKANLVTNIAQSNITNLTSDLALKAPLASPTLVTPALGTPSAGVLTSCTELPIATGLAVGSSANLAGRINDETGTGVLVFNTSPTLITPALGTPASGVLTNCTALPAAQVVAGTMVTGITIPDPTLTFSINAQTGTTYTPVLADAGKIVTLNNGLAITLTIPPNSSVAYPVGSSLTFIQIGAGLTTFAQGVGVTIASTGGTATAPIISATHGSATAIKTATDTWQVIGAIE